MKQTFTRRHFLLFFTVALTACDSPVDLNRAVGQLESDRIELTADFAEPIVDRLVREGEQVNAGQLLLRQDDARILARLAEADAALAQSRARLDELTRGPRKERIAAERATVAGAKKNFEFRQIEFERAAEVEELHLASLEVRDRAKSNLDAARASLDLHEARLSELLNGTTIEEIRQAETAVQQADARRALLAVEHDRHQFTAPVDGIVDSILFETGERPGVGQPTIIMLGGSQPFVRVYVPEALRVSVKSGTEARIFVDGLDVALDGRVRWVSSEAAFTPYFALTEHDRGRLTFFAKVDLLTNRDRLPDGVPVEVEFLISEMVH